MGHGAVTFNRAVSTFASILQIGKIRSVTASAPVPLEMRFIGAAGIAISILLLGWRLVPVTGLLQLLTACLHFKYRSKTE